MNTKTHPSSALLETPSEETVSAPKYWWRLPAISLSVVVVLLVITAFSGSIFELDGILESWAAITSAIVLQATPFLVFGVIVSGTISAFVPASLLRKMTPKNQFVAVPTAACAGFLLPGCECAAVPVANRLMDRGISPAAALTFLLASPAINPVVLVATAIAYNGSPMMVWARLIASIIAATLVGWIWFSFNAGFPFKTKGTDHDHEHNTSEKWELFRSSAVHDLLQAGGFLVIGAMAASFIKVAVPAKWFSAFHEYPILGILVMAALAVALSLCSEADAFIAASFTGVSPTAQLVFLVVGPMIDFKLVAMQYGIWGRRFVIRFVPITLLLAVLSGALVGGLIFGSL